MKYLPSQLMVFMRERGVRRNIGYLRRFLIMLFAMITGYSLLFHYIMAYEGQSFSWLTGLYWTLTVMSTLGFGDITFTSDPGRLFSIIVLLSGVFFFLVMLPFTFIQYFYAPWLEAQKKNQVTRKVAPGTGGHVILVGAGPVVLNLVDDLVHYGINCVLLCEDAQTALDLLDQGYQTVVGEHDDGRVYRNLEAASAAMLVALDSDIRNTSTVFSAREVAPQLPILAKAEQEVSIDILRRAGATHVLQFHKLLGRALARRVLRASGRSSVLDHFEQLTVAEAPIMRTPLVGKTLRQCGLRNKTGVNVVGIWERGVFRLPDPDAGLSPDTVLVIVGASEQIAAFDRLLSDGEEASKQSAAVILGGGRVGLAVAEQLRTRGIDATIVDKADHGEAGAQIGVKGDAADLEVLERAGIRTAPSVVITTHDDATNIYLTIYCRRLRPDIQIISRASLDRNVSVLHAAGADLVLSLASMISMTVINLLAPGSIFMLNEGLNIFRSIAPSALQGKDLAGSGLRTETNCSVVAVRGADGVLRVNPEPGYVFAPGDEIYLIGDSSAERSYYEQYGRESEAAPGALLFSNAASSKSR